MYVFIGMLLGSLVTSQHDNREACEGRKTILAEKGVVGQCVEQKSYITTGTTMNFYDQSRVCKLENGSAICK